MSDAPPVSPPPLSEPNRSPAAPLFCWLVIQLVALSLAVFRVPLSARFPLPGEQFAIHIMLTVQIVASAMLFPFLLRDAATSAMVILTIVPFVQLAGYLSSTPVSRVALAALYVATWLATLLGWRVFFRSRPAVMFAVALAVAWSLGMAIVWYVLAESRAQAGMDWQTDARFGPILGAIAQVEAPNVLAEPWMGALILLVICTSSSSALRFARKRSVGRTGSPPAAR
jgi:hypothetical protein